MNRAIVGFVGLFGVAGHLLVACSGESSNFSKDGDGSSSGATSGSGGSVATGGSTSKGGASTGGAATGGTAGTGGLPEPPDGVCEDITACGGDPQGTWNIRESCLEVLIPIFPDAGCENSPGRASADVTGTFTFQDGTMTTDLMETAHVAVVIDDPCAQALVGSPDITAADVCPLLNAEFMASATTSGTCVAVSGGCRCDATQPAMPSAGTATYQIVGNQLVASDGSTIDFCQQGDELHLHSAAADVGTSTLAGFTLLLDRVQ